MRWPGARVWLNFSVVTVISPLDTRSSRLLTGSSIMLAPGAMVAETISRWSLWNIGVMPPKAVGTFLGRCA